MLRKILLVIATFQGTAHGKVNEVKVCYEEGLKPPYLMVDKEGQPPYGIVVEMVNEILNREKVKITNLVVPWKRCLKEVEDGTVDIVPNTTIKEDRKLFGIYTAKPFYTTHLVLFYRSSKFKEPPKVATLDELGKFQVGGILGFNYDYLENKVKVNTEAEDRIALIKMLNMERFDFALEQKEVYQNLVLQNKVSLDGLNMIPNPGVSSKDYYLLISKKTTAAAEVVSLLDKGLEAIVKDGTADKITKKYLKD